MKYLFWANFLVWIGIGAYLIFLGFKISSLYKEFHDLKDKLKKDKHE